MTSRPAMRPRRRSGGFVTAWLVVTGALVMGCGAAHRDATGPPVAPTPVDGGEEITWTEVRQVELVRRDGWDVTLRVAGTLPTPCDRFRVRSLERHPGLLVVHVEGVRPAGVVCTQVIQTHETEVPLTLDDDLAVVRFVSERGGALDWPVPRIAGSSPGSSD